MFARYFRTALYSLYRPSVYVEVCRHWPGFGFLYLALLLAAGLLPVTLYLHHHFVSFLTPAGAEEGSLPGELETLITQVPEMHLRDGRLHTEAEQPHHILSPHSDIPLITIDAKAHRPAENERPVLFLAQTHLFLFLGKNQSEGLAYRDLVGAMDLPQHGELSINAAGLRQFLLHMRENARSVSFSFYGMAWIFLTGSFVFRALVFSLLASIIAQAMRLRLNFACNLRIASVTCTPVILLDLLSLSLGGSLFAYEQLVYFCLQAAYIYVAMERVRYWGLGARG